MVIIIHLSYTRITDIAHPYNPTLHRIKALIDIPGRGVKAGDLGGYIQSEDNLSQNGDCWVDGNGSVFDNGRVTGNGKVTDNGWVDGNGKVTGNGKAFGDAVIKKPSDILTISSLGSRDDTLTVLYNKTCATGCFQGTVDEFLAAVKETHGNNEYAKLYYKAINFAYEYFDWERV